MQTAKPARAKSPYPPPGYAWYVVGVLALAYVFSFIDRQILSLLVAPIRRDLHISDTQMSLLIGLSFAVFYTFFGLPLGRLADSTKRRNLISCGVAAWSLFSAACGLVRNFGQMLVMRFGVGIGEASLSPSAYSLIADYFPPEKQATALSVYGMGIYVGSGLAFLLGGVVLKVASPQGDWVLPLMGWPIHPWQAVFFVVGLPGLLVAALTWTIREPERRGPRAEETASLAAVGAYLLENRAAFACLYLAVAFMAFEGYGAFAWVPTFFIRTHGWTAAKAGIVYGASVGVFGTLGLLAGGWLADRLASRGCREANLRVGLIGALLGAPLNLIYPLVPSAALATGLLIAALFVHTPAFGLAPAAIQLMVPNRMRAVASALYLFVISLIGLGLGPTAIALLTDHVFHDDGMLRYSLAIVGAAGYAIAAVLWRAGLKPYCRTVDRLVGGSAS